MKRKRDGPEENMEIVWQTPANPPQRQDYIFRDGIRYVRPYYFEFISHAKNRWAGKTIVDLFADEFKGRPRDYYVLSIFKMHLPSVFYAGCRHEPPVMARDVKILHTEPDVVTVCKPASVPVHPCGQYRKNTVVGILQAEHDLAPIFPIHRLDRLVSGLLILARSASKADSFRQQIESGEVKKQYVARVTGVFPEDKQVANAKVNYNAREGKSTVEVENGSNGKSPSKGKDACTKFTRISTNGTQSIVLYRAAAKSTVPIKPSHSEVHVPHSTDEPDEDFNIDPMCTNCPNLAPKGYDGDEEGLWLHCIRYSGPGWTYECPYPEWASLS
ncbi:RNA pseudouridine synthase 7 [Sesamum angolense]|uniref:RNA pseudouridine synthase 7 n=1 Tax=Sesamum angolense TaxID=2727404 RepID=A0AAE2C6S0_9LAMI|nr:RNA pseudouridine synthase 7 [Sesamum angolense]